MGRDKKEADYARPSGLGADGHGQDQAAAGGDFAMTEPGAVERLAIERGRNHVNIVGREIAGFNDEVFGAGEVQRGLWIGGATDEVDVLAGVGKMPICPKAYQEDMAPESSLPGRPLARSDSWRR